MIVKEDNNPTKSDVMPKISVSKLILKFFLVKFNSILKSIFSLNQSTIIFKFFK